MTADPYSILGIPDTATQEDIRSAYRRAAMRWHPDKNPDDPTATERFKAISAAYSMLSDPGKRKEFDRTTGSQSAWAADRQYESDDRFSYEQATNLFFAEMVRLSGELTMQNIPSRDIASELVKRGCPPGIANTIAASVELKRKAMIRNQARKAMVRAIVSFAAGGILTAVLWGLGYIALLGPVFIVSGLYNAIRALYFLSTGRVPRGAIG